MLANCLVSAFTVQPSRWIRDIPVDQIQGYLSDLRVIIIQNAMFICEKPEQSFGESGTHDLEARYK